METQHTNTRRGLTQNIAKLQQNLRFTPPLKGEDVRRTEEGVLNNKKLGASPLAPVFTLLPANAGGKGNASRGFTLIELLVVVLIIGILAAVAVPQYRDVVAKSTLTQLLMTDKRLHQNLKLYRLTRGTHPTQILDLEWDREGTEGHGWPIGYLGKYSYLQYPGSSYVRTSISKAGLLLTCDTWFYNEFTSCYASNDFTINLLTKMKWKEKSGKYIIPVS